MVLGVGLIAATAAVCPAAERPAAAETKALADGIERRISELGGLWQEQDESFRGRSMPLLAGAASLDDWMAGSKEAIEAKAEIFRLIEEDKRAKAPLVVEMTILARRLDRYKRTGELPPPDEGEIAAVARFIDDPWAQSTPDPKLSEDAATLLKQLRRIDELMGRLPSRPIAAAARKPRPPPIPPAAETAAAPARPLPPPRPRPAEERPATLPDLLDWLASENPRRRALAADELGRRGRDASQALTPLRGALEDRDARVRASAALAISTIASPTPEILAELRRALADKNPDVHLSARIALQRLGAPR